MIKKLAARGIPPLTILAIALPAVWPLFQGALACTDDAAFHLLRLTQLDELLRSGVWYSRWAPDMALGYGFPLFNFYAPLSYYAAELFSLPAGNLNLGLRLTFAAGIVLSGLTMYLFTREYTGRPAAYAAAAAYIYAPYQGYDVYFRGNLAESFAWWLLPLALFCAVRLARHGGRRWLALTALSYAAVLLTHNVFALIFSPLLLVWGVVSGVGEKHLRTQDSGLRTFNLQLLLAILAGLALAAFFWLPALVERSLIHTERLLVPPVFVYWGNFVSLGELFALPRTIHPDLINPTIPRALGLAQVLLALPSLLWLWPGRRNSPGGRRPFVATALGWVVLVFLIFMMLSPSRPLWDLLPLVEFIQFPWRLLGIVAVLLALLVGLGVEGLVSGADGIRGGVGGGRGADGIRGGVGGGRGADGIRGYGVSMVGVALIMLTTLYWFNPRYCPGLSDPTVGDIVRFELATQTIGTTAKGEYLPLTVDALPAEPYSAPFSPPAGVEILHAGREPLTLQAEIQAEAPAVLTANVINYPGWTATVDGNPTPITPSPTTGLITVPIPAGSSTVNVEFQETPLRRATNVISVLAALITAILLVPLKSAVSNQQLATSHQQTAIHHSPFTIHHSPFTIHHSQLFLSFITTLLIALFIIFLLPHLNSPLYRPALPDLEGRPQAAAYREGLTLLDYRLGAREMPADGSLPVTLWLTAERPLPAFYQSRVQLVDQEGEVWSGPETVWPRIYRPYYDTRDWPLDPPGYAEELLLAEALPGTPPGTYTVELVIFDRAAGQPTPLADGRTALPLGTVELIRPETPFSDDGRIPIDPSAGDFGPLRLLSVSPDREEAAVGDPFLLTAFWLAEEEPAVDYTVHLQLLEEESGRILIERTYPPVRADWPASRWQEGDVWRGRYRLRLPAGLPAGTYRWGLCLTRPGADCQEPLLLSRLAVSAPARTFDPPELDIKTDRALGDLATLLGANLTPCPGAPALPCAAELVWRAESETGTSYRVFLQLLGPDGNIVAQSDGEPASWTRPTTGWLPGEIVRDPRTLTADLPDLPAGRYTLIAGLYDPATGTRLPTPDGRDEITITTVDQP